MRLINHFHHFHKDLRADGCNKFKAHGFVVYCCVKWPCAWDFLIESGFASFVLDDNVFDFFEDLYQNQNVRNINDLFVI